MDKKIQCLQRKGCFTYELFTSLLTFSGLPCLFVCFLYLFIASYAYFFPSLLDCLLLSFCSSFLDTACFICFETFLSFFQIYWWMYLEWNSVNCCWENIRDLNQGIGRWFYGYFSFPFSRAFFILGVW